MSHPTSSDSINLPTTELNLIDLKKWRQQIFDADWHTVEETLRADQCQEAIICRDREFSLSISRQLVERSRYIPINDHCIIALVVSIKSDLNDRFAVVVEFWPTESQYLPGRLRLSILDESNDPVIETHTRDDNQKIEMKFDGEEGDHFHVRIALKEDSSTISFII